MRAHSFARLIWTRVVDDTDRWHELLTAVEVNYELKELTEDDPEVSVLIQRLVERGVVK